MGATNGDGRLSRLGGASGAHTGGGRTLKPMLRVWRRFVRIELAWELAIMGVVLELFHRGIRPALDVGCGSAPSQFSDDTLFFVSGNHLTLIVPALVALIELSVAFRPWVKRAVRLGLGTWLALMLSSYSVLVWSVVRR